MADVIPTVKFEKPTLPTLWLDTSVVIKLAKIKKGEKLQEIEVERGRRLHNLIVHLVHNAKLLPAGVHQALTSSLLAAWMDKNKQYPVAKYLPLGTSRSAYNLCTYGDISGGEAWKATEQFRRAGVPADLLQQLLEWGIAYTDRAARIQY